jgi:precorrin-4/cobalt-precorrin-4 C11-methyltransferase
MGGVEMTVYFIGAGPGAADLITVRGRDVLARTPVCLYAGSLVPVELLDVCPPGARLVDTASVFSAMAEQLRRLDAAGVPYEIVPGVPAFAAAAASLGRELTVPGVGQTLILTRTAARATPMPPGEELSTLAASRATIVLHLAVQRIAVVVEELIPWYGEDCPVAVVARASRPDEVILRGTLAGIAAQVREAGILRTAVIVVGRVLTAEEFPDSHLYSTTRPR